ncbi:MAG TPA: amidohydrolase family protein [Steroidobacteraceae bacterium]|nr:amidohydrolase family protein [Steroidobacteraceae bacterium]
MRILIERLQFLLSVDAHDRVIADAAVLIEDDRVADLGVTAEVLARHGRSAFDRIVDGRRRGMCPGFIDSHVHLSETLSRGMFPDNLDTRTWVFHWAKPFYAHVETGDEQVSVLLACTEMLRSGTTCFLDMGAQNDPAGTIAAIERSGIRGITGIHAADTPPATLPSGWTEEMIRHHFFPSAREALEALGRTVERWHNSASGRIRCWVNIEGKEPCSLELHVGARRLAEQHGVGTTYHLATSIEEARLSEKKYGKWPVQRVADAGGLGSNLVIAHAVALTDGERQLLAENDTKVAFCPGTSLKLAKGATVFGRYPELIEAGVTVSLGTDGVSASGNLNLMRQMYVAAGLFKDGRNDAGMIGARKALRMATIDGARALGWSDEIGSLEVGKKADFVLFDLDHVEWTPYGDPLQTLVWSASSASIAETWVNGQPLYRDGRILTVDEEALRCEARVRCADIQRRAGLMRGNTPLTTSLYT